MAEAFDFVQKKNIALVSSQPLKRSVQGHSQCGMRAWSARLKTRCLLRIVARHFLLAKPAAPRVVAGVDQDPVGPGDETRLAAKTADTALHLQERLLHGVFRVDGIAKNIPRHVLHAHAMHCVETLVSAQITRPAASGQCGILTLGIHDGRAGAAGKVLGRFHSRPSFAQRGRDSSPPRQRKSHSSHPRLLWYRRQRRAKRQAGEPATTFTSKPFIFYRLVHRLRQRGGGTRWSRNL